MALLVPRRWGIEHAGTVHTRGPLALSLEGWAAEHPLAGPALEHVVAWYGYPMDRVVGWASTGGLAWGCWGLGPPLLARALAELQRRAPDAFTTWAETAGVDLTARPGDGAPDLVVIGPKGDLVCGPAAVAIVARDPARIAALARLARTESAQQAQVHTLVHHVLAPLTSLDARPRSLAVLALCALRGGPPAVRTLVEVLADESALLREAESHLDPDLAHEVHRILTSPERSLT